MLAAELRDGRERRDDVRALASILAAQLATFVTVLPEAGGQTLVVGREVPKLSESAKWSTDHLAPSLLTSHFKWAELSARSFPSRGSSVAFAVAAFLSRT